MSRSPAKHAAEYRLYRLLAWLFKALPEAVALGGGASFGWFAGVVLRLRRTDVDRHFAVAFPDRTPGWRRRVARRCYLHFGREFVALLRLASTDAHSLVERTTVDGLDALRSCLHEGRGVVLVTGHLGNWEIGGAALSARGFPLDAVAKGMANLRFGADLAATRERLGMKIIDMSVAPRAVLRSLRAGRVTALLADQNAGENGVFVSFFGEPASTARGPALFALRTGAPVMLGTCVRVPGRSQRYHVVLRRIEVRTSGDLDRDLLQLTQDHTEALEEAIRRAPDQYFWLHKRWKTAPPEEPPIQGSV